MNTQRGGAGRGQGRKPIKEGQETVTVSLRITELQRRKLALLGGAKWVRKNIDREKEFPVDLSKPTMQERKMDIEKVRVARREMDDAIQAAVNTAINVFHAKTGMYPQSFNISFVNNITTFGDRDRRFAAVEVRAESPFEASI